MDIKPLLMGFRKEQVNQGQAIAQLQERVRSRSTLN